jgi:hypothetical protein
MRGQTDLTAMLPHLRLLARLLRVLVTCVALGIVWGAPMRAMAWTDVAAWIAGSRRAAPGEHPEVEAEQSRKQGES